MTSVRSPGTSDTTKIPFLPAPLTLVSFNVMYGANAHYSHSVIQQTVDFGVLTNSTSRLVGQQFAENFLSRFQSLKSFLPNNGISKEFAQRLHSPEGLPFQEILLEAIIAVESAIAFSMHELNTVSYAAIEKGETNSDLIWECLTLPKLSREVAKVALVGVIELLPDMFQKPSLESGNTFDVLFSALSQQARRRRMAPSTAVIKYTASLKSVPCQLLGRQHLLLGQGKNQQQMYASMTDSTSIAAQKICADKRLTNKRLKELRLPIPKQSKVGTVKSALKAANKLGFPLVVKPVKGRKGEGITVGLKDLEGIEAAFNRAHKKGSDVIIEQLVPGADCRMLVIGGKFVAAVNRQPPILIGDGKSTIAKLLEELNADPYRDGFRGFKVELDDEVQSNLDKAGVALDEIMESGRKIVLRLNSNVSTGGVPVDVTDQVHPDNREMAVRAATGVGLDVAGIDMLTDDISRSYRETGSKIVEINSRPGLDIHVWPMIGKSRNVALELLKLSFPDGQQGRVPILSVAGDNGTGSIARILDMILRGAGRNVALAMRSHSYINGVSAGLSESQQHEAPQVLLRDPQIDTLVNTVSLRHTAKEGLLLDQCSVSIIMDRVKHGGAASFNRGIEIISNVATDCIIVGADNIVALDRISKLKNKKRLILVSDRANSPGLIEHLKNDGEAVTSMWHDNEVKIVLMFEQKVVAAFPFSVSSRGDGRVRRKRLNTSLMYAVAAAYASGMSGEDIQRSLNNAPPIIPEAES